MINQEVDKLISGLTDCAREWTELFVTHMRENYPSLPEVVSFQMPTFKLGDGKMRNYIAFSTAAKHFSLHCTDFDYIAELKTRMKKPGKGKGCVNCDYTNTEEQAVLFAAISDIVKRAGL